MNIVADESVDSGIVEHLRQDGHEVRYVAEMQPGLPDDAVLDLATREESVLLTADKDFGEMVFRLRRFTKGIVLLRLAGLSAARKTAIVATALNRHPADLVEGFTVITPGACRTRHPHQ